MSPENAKVFHVEDNASTRETIKEFLELHGHTVIDSAGSLQDALDKIPYLNEHGIQVAIVDGNLSPDDSSGRDGELVAGKIKERYPGVIVIGNSLRDDVKGADINSPKVDGASKLASIVTSA